MRRIRSPLLLYPLVALLSFPTITSILGGTGGWWYALDLFDDGGGLARLAITVRDWSAHGFTLWDPYINSGNALLGQFSLPPYSPDVALAFVVGPFWAMAIMAWLTASLAGIGMHLFLRDGVGLPPLAVGAGAVMAVLCFWLPIYGVSVAILPLLLWLGDRAASDGPHRRRWVAASVVAATLSLYAGLLQLAVFSAAIHLAWVLWSRPGARTRGAALWAGAWGLAMGLYAPVLVTQLVLLPISQRSAWQLDPGGLVAAIQQVGRHYSVALTGTPVLRGRDPDDPRYGMVFLGGIGLILLVAGLLGGRRRRPALFLVALLFAVPAADFLSIVFKTAYDHVGLLRSFQFVRIRHFFPFAEAGVVALGVEALRARLPGLLAHRRLVIAGAAVALLAVVVEIAFAVRRAIPHLTPFGGQPADVGWPVMVLALGAGLVGGVIVVIRFARHGEFPAGRLLVALCLLFVGERALLATGTLLVGNNIATFDQRLALNGAERFLLAQPGVGSTRMLTFGDHANRMGFVGLREADGYQAIYPVAYQELFGALTAPGLDTSRTKWEYFHWWGGRAYAFFPQVDPELVSLAGIRWLYVADGSVPTVPGLVEQYRDTTARVYENPAAFPRAFVVGAVEGAPDDAAVLGDLSNASLETLAGRAYVTGADAAAIVVGGPSTPGSTAAVRGTPGPDGTATITTDDPDRIAIDVSATRDGILVLTDTASPGWVAAVDGRTVPIRTVDAAFRGVAVPAGSHQVTFRYEPSFTYRAFWLAALALLLVPAWLWIAGRRGRFGISGAGPD